MSPGGTKRPAKAKMVSSKEMKCYQQKKSHAKNMRA
jgi:hypothetical protein